MPAPHQKIQSTASKVIQLNCDEREWVDGFKHPKLRVDAAMRLLRERGVSVSYRSNIRYDEKMGQLIGEVTIP